MRRLAWLWGLVGRRGRLFGEEELGISRNGDDGGV